MAMTKRAQEVTMTSNAASDDALKEDRLSELPRALIDIIFDTLTTNEVARMSVLSKTWKQIWDTQNKLVLDRAFFLGTNATVQRYPNRYMERVSNILALHKGDLRRFEFSIPYRQKYFNIDNVVITLSRKKIQELVLTNDFRYSLKNFTVPPCIYLCNELTYLDMYRCFIHTSPPPDSKCFQLLHTIVLEYCTFTPNFGYVISKLPMLGSLSLTACSDLRFLEQLPGSLHTLNVDFSPEFNWGMLRHKSNVKKFVICWLGRDIQVDIRRNVEDYFNMTTFLYNLPCLNYLSLDGCSFKYLAKGGPLNRYINGDRVCASNLTDVIISVIDFNDLDIVRCLLYLLRSTCSLESLEIRGSDRRSTDEERAEVVNCMKDGAENKMELEKLTTVRLRHLNGLQTEMHLIKLLYAQSPSFKDITLDFRPGFDDVLQNTILDKISKFTMASKVVQTYYSSED